MIAMAITRLIAHPFAVMEACSERPVASGDVERRRGTLKDKVKRGRTPGSSDEMRLGLRRAAYGEPDATAFHGKPGAAESSASEESRLQPGLAARIGWPTKVPQRSTSSTRRFLAFPSSSLFEATGDNGPLP
jgi:hypothetical protein